MMKIVATFNVPFYEYEVDGYQAMQVTAPLEKVEGVESAHLLRAVEGKPSFSLEIDCTDESVESVSAEAEKMMGQYSAYIADVNVRTYRRLA
jgi:hypothetical protein